MRRRLLLTIALCLSLCSALVRAAARKPPKPPSAKEIKLIEAAAPTRARVRPAQPRKLLVFTGCQGFVHGSIPFEAKALEIMGQKTGAFAATVSDDIAMFEPATLAQFDAVCMANTTMRQFVPANFKELKGKEREAALARDARLKKSFLDFVKGGKGLVGIHAATDCFYAWPEYGDMIGGYFQGHPWHEDVRVKNDDPAHPLNAAFKGQDFTIKDEIYQFRDPYSRKKLRVLLSLDTSKTNMNKGDKIKRKDGDFAVSWVHRYGKGLVFFCSLGHRNEICWNPMILQYYLDGIQFALGDLPADTTPSAELDPAYVEKSRAQARAAGLVASFKELAQYKLGGNDTAAKLIATRVVDAQKAGAAERDMLETELAALLRPDTTADCKRFVCRQLYLIGTEKSVPALAKLLTDPELCDMARYGLERMPGDAATAALRDALGKTRGRAKVGVANSLGERKDAKSVPALAKLLADSSADIAAAAAASLGKIGGDAAVKALTSVKSTAPRLAVDAALIRCAQQMLAAKQAAKAIQIAQPLLADGKAVQVRVAAFEVVASARAADALDMVLSALTGKDAHLRRAAMPFVRTLPGAEATRALASALPKIAAAGQTMLLQALADRGDKLALPAVVTATKSEDEGVRVAALRALASLGDKSVVALLLDRAVKAPARSAEQKAAQASLDRLAAPGVDDALVASLKSGDASLRTEAVERLKARRAASAVPTLLAVADKDAESKVRRKALAALGVLAGEKDLSALVAILMTRKKGSEQTQAEKVAATVAKKIEDETKRCDVVLAALAKTADPAVRGSLFRTLGRIGAKEGLAPLRAALKDPAKDVQDAAVRALADWPNCDALDTLVGIAKSTNDTVRKVLALRGYARLIALPSERSTTEALKLYEQGLQLASRDEERKLILATLGNVSHPRALALAQSFAENPALQDEAMAAAAQIYHQLSAPKAVTASRNPGKARNAIDGDIKTRWDTGQPQKPGQWFMIDLGFEREIKSLTLDAGKSRSDYPKGYEVYVSMNKDDWGEPVAKGRGKKTVAEIACRPKIGRYIKIVQTRSLGGWFWSIHEMKINGKPAAPSTGKKIEDRSKWQATASPAPEDAKLAFDGDIKTRWGTRGKQKPDQWFQLDLGAEHNVLKLVLDPGDKRNDYPRKYKVYVSQDGKTWGPPVSGGQGARDKKAVFLYPKAGRFIKIVQTGSSDNKWWSIYEMDVFAEAE